MKKAIANRAASVHARLKNRAKADGRLFNELLQYYAMERFLYRVSCSAYLPKTPSKDDLINKHGAS